MDSQSAQVAKEVHERGSDSKKVKGRKRHLLVDTEGLPVVVVVTKASVNDKAGARLLLKKAQASLPHLRKVWADAGYTSEPLAREAQVMGIDFVVIRRLAHVQK